MYDKSNITTAINALNNDGVICYATEGVWGLGCHPQSKQAFKRLLQIKNRPLHKGVILIAGDISQLYKYIEINDDIIKLFNAHRNDFITFVVPKSQSCPQYLCGDFDSVAVRITNYQHLKELCLLAKTPIVSTSANKTGQETVKSIKQAQEVFADRIDSYVTFPLGNQNKPSKIIKWNNGAIEIIRQ